MLSLAPRYDLFRFEFPKEFIPGEIYEKYQKYLMHNPGVITDPLNYLNESVRGINFPGITDLVITQPQHSYNTGITPERKSTGKKSDLGRINVEPIQQNTYKSPSNPLSNIERICRVSFRLNQDMMNYFMLLEILFYYHGKHLNYQIKHGDLRFTVYFPDETGRIISKIDMDQCLMSGLDGIEFSYDKVSRDTGDFSMSFNFNNINYTLYPEDLTDVIA